MDLTYTLNNKNDGLVVTGCKDLSGELIIPSEHEYEGMVYPVTEIGEDAFSDSNVTSVIIPDSVTKIGQFSFFECEDLVHVAIPSSVTEIEPVAFGGCTNLANITIPDSVTFIGEGAFSECRSLKSIEIPNSVKTLQSQVFMGCSNL